MNAACGGDGPVRTVQSGWTRGFQTSVGGYASAITYHPQGLWKDITRTNGVKDNPTAWQGQGRPGRIYTTGASGGNFDTGLFDYDGAGNIKRMGNDDFGYDQVSRLWYAEAACTGTTAASCHRQQYEYDAAGRGNLFKVTTQPRGGAQSTVQWAMDTNTNRLSSAGYDVAGNMTQSPYHGSLGYDSQDALVRMGPGGDNASRVHAYTASGERAWTVVRVGTNWSQLLWVRGLGEEVLRVYTRTTPPLGGWSVDWNWASDTVWRGGQRLAQVSPSGTRHEHLDHLGTPRLHTNQSGQVTQRLDVYPFGRDTPETSSPAVAFTGHERDNLGTVDGTDDMDYMHARFYSPQMGRFFSADPKARRHANRDPQRWNRYAYVAGNPLKYVDPDGRDVMLFVRNNSGGGFTNFGHVALRVHGTGYDKTFDFGRYRGGRGLLRAKGSGILRVWSDFSAFKAGQRASGGSQAVNFTTTADQDKQALEFFQKKIDQGTKLPQTSSSFVEYQLQQDYDLTSNNFTTICVEAIGSVEDMAAEAAALEGQYDPRELYEILEEVFKDNPDAKLYEYVGPLE